MIPPLLVRQVPPPKHLFTDEVRTALDRAHPLAGFALRGSPPTLFFRAKPPPNNADDRLMFVAYGWDGTFGSALTVTAMSRRGNHARVLIPAGSPVLADLSAGHFVAVMTTSDGSLAAFEVEAPRGIESENFDDQLRRVQDHVPALDDPRAYYWELLGAMDFLKDSIAVQDRFKIGWASQYARYVNGLEHAIAKMAEGSPPRSSELPHGPLKEFIDGVCGAGGDPSVPSVLATIRAIHTRSASSLIELLAAQNTYDALCHEPDKGENHSHCALLSAALETYLRSSDVTNEGLRVPWYDGVRSGVIEFLTPSPVKFPPSFDPAEYWRRLPNSLFCNLGHLIGPDEVPCAPASEDEPWLSFPRAENVEEVLAASDALLEEAVAHKIGCIPNGAILQLAIGNFSTVRIWEREKQIDFVFYTQKAEFATAHLELHGARPLDFGWLDRLPPESDERQMAAAVRLLLAATVRDFFVVEEREHLFTEKKSSRSIPWARSPADGPLTIYLPRVKYRSTPDVGRAAEQLQFQERRAHPVGGHLRAAPSASAHQLALAARYGIPVPTGYTFVRPHRRGDKEREVVYRSRSALQSLYAVEVEVGPSGSRASDGWFQFERDVKTLMRRLGFDVAHVAAARNGDEGIDVLATKGADLNAIRWIIQCKCYGPKNKVGPATVRELLGALKGQPVGTRGMIVTTSSFTSGARELADAEGVRLMPADEFRSKLSGA